MVIIGHHELWRSFVSTISVVKAGRPFFDYVVCVIMLEIDSFVVKCDKVHALYAFFQFSGIFLELRRFLFVDLLYFIDGGNPLFFFKIGTSPNGTTIGQCDHIQRPTGTSGHKLYRIDVDLVYIGTLLTIHLH